MPKDQPLPDISTISSYQAGVYQARAYRTFRRFKEAALKPYDLSMMEWTVLGVVYDAGDVGVRLTELAHLFDTSQAFITKTVNELFRKELVARCQDSDDSRAKRISIPSEKRPLVEEIEQHVRAELRRTLYDRISRDELNTFVHVLMKFGRD